MALVEEAGAFEGGDRATCGELEERLAALRLVESGESLVGLGEIVGAHV